MPSSEHPQTGRITRWLSNTHSLAFSLYAIGAAFGTYFCMYAFRKPYGAATFEGLKFFGTTMDLKASLTISQIIGYATAKYLGMKFCSEASRSQRLSMLVFMVASAEGALALFAILDPNWKFIGILLNGLSLGMIWGLVVRYLEGRRSSEVLLVGLSLSYIVAGGAVRQIGDSLLKNQLTDQFWMPVTVGGLFIFPFIVCVWLLNQLPEPSEGDIAERVKRIPMKAEQRWKFVREFMPGLLLVMLVYFFLSAFRDIRDNFESNLFRELKIDGEKGNFLLADAPIAIPVFLSLLVLNSIRGHIVGMVATFGIMISGTLILGLSTLAFDAGYLGPLAWIFLIGMGAYLTYVPYGTVVFDRLIASTGFAGTAVFAIYIADSIGYSGSVVLQLYKEFATPDTTWVNFFRGMSYSLSIGGSVLLTFAAIYFIGKVKRARSSQETISPAHASK